MELVVRAISRPILFLVYFCGCCYNFQFHFGIFSSLSCFTLLPACAACLHPPDLFFDLSCVCVFPYLFYFTVYSACETTFENTKDCHLVLKKESVVWDVMFIDLAEKVQIQQSSVFIMWRYKIKVVRGKSTHWQPLTSSWKLLKQFTEWD